MEIINNVTVSDVLNNRYDSEVNYWYASRANEIFIDTDNFERSIRHTCSRLLGAIKCGRLVIKNIEWHTSKSQGHIHTVITLANDMPEIERYIWAMILHSDIYRTASNVMRSLYNVNYPDILITPNEFEREPDCVCTCEGKHTAEVMAKCPAAIELRGDDRLKAFFGKPETTEWNLNDINVYVHSITNSLFEEK